MISLEKLINQLQHCKDTQIKLPADNETSPFIQKTAVDIRKAELQAMVEETEKMGNAVVQYEQYDVGRCTMDSEFKDLGGGDLPQQKRQNEQVIAPRSLIVYSENECAALPEVMLNIFKVLALNSNEWFIYGVKNPESFYKSFLHLVKIDFIIKNRSEKKNELATFKREMALQYENYYKLLDYRRWHFNKSNMVGQLTNEDNYTGIDIFQFICDYTKTNMIILDVVEEQYIALGCSKRAYEIKNEFKPLYGDDYICIVKYVNNTYMPLMNSNSKNAMSSAFLNYITANFEKMNFRGFTGDVVDGNSGKVVTDDVVIIRDDGLDVADSVKKPIIDSNEIGIVEDMIIVDEEESSDLTVALKKSLEYVEPKYVKNEDEDESALESRICGGKPVNLEDLMSKIPTKGSISGGSKVTKRKSPKATKTVSDTDANIEKVVEQEKEKVVEVKCDAEKLKPLKQYTLADLQMMCKIHKIPTQKDGKGSKQVNKTKDELYRELESFLG